MVHFYHLNDISIYLARQRGGGVPNRKNKLEALSCSFCPHLLEFQNVCEVKRSECMCVQNDWRHLPSPLST